MDFGKAIGTACLSFALTNIDDIFVLVTFFAEASSPDANLTALKILVGQYLGFTVIVMLSAIGYAFATVVPAEPNGFLGLLPILLGCWRGLEVLSTPSPTSLPLQETPRIVEPSPFPSPPSATQSKRKNLHLTGLKPVGMVALITIMNGGDNTSTYIPLFSQARVPLEIAIYITVYYTLLSIWILTAWLVMKQRHVLALAQCWARCVVPLLYVGLGVHIVVSSGCYPWSVGKMEDGGVEGRVVIGAVATVVVLRRVGGMVWYWVRRKRGVSVLDFVRTRGQ
ncbi:hypothetical protein BDV96DRAFT_598631 [Lophiotrema nucula]|uniref:Cadmium resistance transporter n=1 Tax=Lophiotrema nucula TaxID=690887 RepID=A0A6A5ZBE2_9PLEO|nr:hypothetical protein BDV96DRAFT_598631 [Lophiotrema nucula]